MSLKSWLKSKCDGCKRLDDARDQDELTRAELAKVKDRAQQIGEALKATRETNVALGRELERSGNELRCAKVEIQTVRKRLEDVEASLKNKQEECRILWDQKAELLKEMDAYKALLRVDELQRCRPMKSKSNRRQHPHLKVQANER